MSRTRDDLVRAARSVCGEFSMGDGLSAGSVGAALLTAQGNVYTGVCMDLSCGLGFCAEVAAIAEMLKHRETHVVFVVAVSARGILPPCGRCRETLCQVDTRNLDCRVAVSDVTDSTLAQLLPANWRSERAEMATGK